MTIDEEVRETIIKMRDAAGERSAEGDYLLCNLMTKATDYLETYKSLYEELKEENLETIRLIGETKKEAEIGAIREFAKALTDHIDSYIEQKEAPALPFTMSALDGVKQIISNIAEEMEERKTNV